MELFLKREALWCFVHNPPNSPMSAADTASDQKALAHIILSLSDSQLVFVRSQQSAKGAWDSLKAVYAKESAGTLIALMRRFCELQMVPGGSVQEHFNGVAGQVDTRH